MNHRKNYFPFTHETLDGVERQVPLYLHEGELVDQNTNTLLQAFNIIGGTLQEQFGGKVSRVVEYTGSVLAHPEDREGVIIEFAAAGSVIVTPQKTTVSVINRGTWEIPTELFFDALYVWAQYEQDTQ